MLSEESACIIKMLLKYLFLPLPCLPHTLSTEHPAQADAPAVSPDRPASPHLAASEQRSEQRLEAEPGLLQFN